MSENSNINRPELVIALILPIGVRRGDLVDAIKKALKPFDYKLVRIKISDLIKRSSNWVDPGKIDQYSRIRLLQEEGNKIRKDGAKFWEKIDGLSEKDADGAALARAAIAEIREHRAKSNGDPEKLCGSTVFILDQLKHPDEVTLLRNVYGSSFILIGGHAPKDKRQNRLINIIDKSNDRLLESEELESQASELMEIDEKQGGDYEQNTRETYPKADFFVNFELVGGEHGVTRFIQLFFGEPFISPTQHEYAMYHARATSLRSSDESRQVGAVIADYPDESTERPNLDIAAVGCNEVPRGGGGLYWEGYSPETRDQLLRKKGDDRPKAIKRDILIELFEKIEKLGWLNKDAKQLEEMGDQLLDHFKKTQFDAIGEFGRTVHAEMAALMDAARRGVSVDKHAMYVTTFPCHNCAKHIIAAGIRRVIYLEPYPKSRTKHLHAEDVRGFDLDSVIKSIEAVEFSPFHGVAPRQYSRLFSMTKRGKKNYKALEEWNLEKATLSPRYVERNAFKSYLLSERQELEKIPDKLFDWDLKKLMPDTE